MKEKKLKKHLVLNKATIVDLTVKQKDDIKAGGVDETFTTKGTVIICCNSGCYVESYCVCH